MDRISRTGKPRQVATIDGHALHRCPRCGLQFFDPQPDDQTLATIYDQNYYAAWGLRDDESSTRIVKLATFDRLLRPVRERFLGSLRLLDYGAATGYLMEKAHELGMEPYGVESSEFAARHCARRFGPDRVFSGSFDEAFFEGVDHDFFEVITMIDFIEHLRDPLAALLKAINLLKPEGLLLILTPDAGSLSRRLMGVRWLHFKTEHLFYFCPQSLSRAVCRAGFADVRIGRAWKTMNLHYVAHQMQAYPHPLITPILRSLHRLSPPFLRKTELFGLVRRTACHGPEAACAGKSQRPCCILRY